MNNPVPCPYMWTEPQSIISAGNRDYGGQQNGKLSGNVVLHYTLGLFIKRIIWSHNSKYNDNNNNDNDNSNNSNNNVSADSLDLGQVLMIRQKD